jgi:hypothetical protein
MNYLNDLHEFNFGYSAVLHYLEATEDLMWLIDSHEQLDPNPASHGGLLMRTLGSVIAINLTIESWDFAVQIVENDYSGSRIQFMLLPNGDDLEIFLTSLRNQIAHEI